MPAPEFLEGKYDVISKIREGGMGAVYKVRHRLLREMRVVKVMHPQVAASTEQRKRFVREAQTATRLRHPNIVTFYDFAIDPDGTAYMVMEYIDGTDLSDLVRRLGPVPVPMGLVLLRQCLSALGYLHRKGIVHRDISPDNILLCRDEEGGPQGKLIDLGIAKVARDEENLTAADEFLGKLRYASPEQLTGPADGSIDGRSDLYSLGAVIYEIFTGVCPFRGKSLQSILAAHLTGPPVPFSESDPQEHIPEGLRKALLRALEIRVEDRFQTGEDFLAALEPLPQRPSPEETREFLDRALGPLRERDSDATAVHLPPPPIPSTEEVQTEAGGTRLSGVSDHSGARTTAPPAPSTPGGSTRPPISVERSPERTVPRALPSERGAERTQFYQPRPAEQMAGVARKARPIRFSWTYGAIAAAAIAGLALIWLRSAHTARPSGEAASAIPPVLTAPPASSAPVPTQVPWTGTPVLPTVPPSAGLTSPSVAPTELPAPDVEVPPTVPRRLEPTRRSPERRKPETRATADPRMAWIPSPKPVPSPAFEPPLDAAKTRYCARSDPTSYTQGAVKEIPVGSAPGTGAYFRSGRTDAARIHIDILVHPEQPREGEPFTVTAKIFNDGDMDLIVRKIEESIAGNYRPVEGVDLGAVSIGGYRQIYAYRGTLSSGGTYRKDLRVTDSTGDSWKTSLQIVPCR